MTTAEEQRAAWRSRLELLDALEAALRRRDDVVAAVSTSNDDDDARRTVKALLQLRTDELAQAVLDLQIRRLNRSFDRWLAVERQRCLDDLSGEH